MFASQSSANPRPVRSSSATPGADVTRRRVARRRHVGCTAPSPDTAATTAASAAAAAAATGTSSYVYHSVVNTNFLSKLVAA